MEEATLKEIIELANNKDGEFIIDVYMGDEDEEEGQGTGDSIN